MFIFELEFLLLFLMITSYVILFGNIIIQVLNSFLRVESKKRNFKLDLLVTSIMTFLYLCCISFEEEKYIVFLMSTAMLVVLSLNLFNSLFSFFNKDVDTQIRLLKKRENVQFYLRSMNPYIRITGLSLIFSLIVSTIIPVILFYKIIIVIIMTQSISLVSKNIMARKISYYNYLVDMVQSEGEDIRFQDITKFADVKGYSIFEVYLLEKILYTKREESFFLIEKNKNRTTEILMIKALINYKMYSLIKATAEDRKYLDANEDVIIEILKSIQKKDFFRAELIFSKLNDENKLAYKDIESIIKKNKPISFDEHYDDPMYYIIEPDDYSRTNPKENYFHKFLKFKLLEAFDNKCAKTLLNTELEMDHFFIPKSHGGNFIMKRKDGKYVLNAIPLNKEINQQKSNLNYKNFFSDKEIEDIFIKINHLNEELNSKDFNLWKLKT